MQTHQIKSFRSADQLMHDNMIVKHYAGSLAYGTALPTSDVDFRGIFVADPVNVRTPFFPVYECDDTDEVDTKLYEVANFLKLCLECNPNIIETLWVDDESITMRTPAYDLLRSNKERLLSSKIAFTTSGYALSQLKRIKGHNKWINQPQPVEPPRQIDYVSMVFNLTEKKIFNKDFHLKNFRYAYRLVPYGSDVYGLYEARGYTTFDDTYYLSTGYDEVSDFHTIKPTILDYVKSFGFPNSLRRKPLFIVKFNKDVYKLDKEKHSQYWEWKKNRNQARSALEEKHGFDTKHAMHLVRLLRMGVEALRDGKIIVKRPDASELLSIRDGAWTYDQIVRYAEDMDLQVREYWYNKTELPKKPDVKFAAQLLMDVQDIVWSNKNNGNSGNT